MWDFHGIQLPLCRFQTTYCLKELTALLKKKARERLGEELSDDYKYSVSDLETRYTYLFILFLFSFGAAVTNKYPCRGE